MDNIFLVVGVSAILVAALSFAIYKFIKLGKEKQTEMILEWLLLAVVQAEKELGGGTGQIKLRFVYDLFTSKFKVISRFMSFAQFSLLVDMALDRMKDMLNNNKELERYINGEVKIQ